MENSIGRDPHLTEALLSDYTALQNDLEQARALARDYETELSDKTNNLAFLRKILDKTSADLNHLQENVAALRQERHRLANKAMLAVAYEMKLTSVTTERDQLKLEVEALHKALARARQSAVSPETERSIAAAMKPNVVSKPSSAQENIIELPFGDHDHEDIQIYPSSQEVGLRIRQR